MSTVRALSTPAARHLGGSPAATMSSSQRSSTGTQNARPTGPRTDAEPAVCASTIVSGRRSRFGVLRHAGAHRRTRPNDGLTA